MLILVSCEDELLSSEKTHDIEFCRKRSFDDSKVYLRLYNISAFNLNTINVENEHVFDFVEAGEFSCTAEMDNVWQYPTYMSLNTMGKHAERGTYCFVVGDQLDPGYYNLILSVFRTSKNEIMADGSAYEIQLPSFEKNGSSQNCPDEIEYPCDHRLNTINIKIANDTAFDICDFSIKENEGREVYLGKIPSGKATCHFSFDNIRSSDYECSFTINGKLYQSSYYYTDCQFDEVTPGDYTYAISLFDLQSDHVRSFLFAE